MITEILRKENWEKHRIDVALRVLGRVDSLLTRIRDGAGKRLDGLERTRAKLDERRRKLETDQTPAEEMPEDIEKAA